VFNLQWANKGSPSIEAKGECHVLEQTEIDGGFLVIIDGLLVVLSRTV
jgi:hypothetical protein